jgi:small-conductance mechanosensitive channel
VGNTFEALEDHIEGTLEHYSALAGKIFPSLSKLFISPKTARKIFKQIQKVQEPGDWIFIFLLGWVTIPAVKYPYEKMVIGSSKQDTAKTEAIRPFQETFVYHFADHLSQAGKLAALVYGLDCIAIALETIGFSQVTMFSPYLAKAIYTVWIFSRFNKLKRFLVFKAFGVSNVQDMSTNPSMRGHLARAKIINRILELLCLAGCFFVMIDVLKVKSGVTLKSLFAVSGASTVIFSLAVKDVAIEVVSGLALQASDKVYEGEKVLFGNGLKGTVDQIGLFETLIRDSSEMVTAVPNKELSNQRLTNISRNKFSQVKQKIHFGYGDLDKLPMLLLEIRREIKESCPEVVTDGSKPFRTYFHSFEDCYLEVVVDVRMTVTPDSDYYYQSREQVLFAIGRAVDRMNMKFAVLSLENQ